MFSLFHGVFPAYSLCHHFFQNRSFKLFLILEREVYIGVRSVKQRCIGLQYIHGRLSCIKDRTHLSIYLHICYRTIYCIDRIRLQDHCFCLQPYIFQNDLPFLLSLCFVIIVIVKSILQKVEMFIYKNDKLRSLSI